MTCKFWKKYARYQFLYPLKTSQNLLFSEVFWGYRKWIPCIFLKAETLFSSSVPFISWETEVIFLWSRNSLKVTIYDN